MKRGRKPTTKRQSFDQTARSKSLGLFDHVKQITQVQNSDYFKNLSDEDKKSFNHFMILRAISMNPSRLEDVSLLFRYFSIIPSPQLYTLLISLFPSDRRYYPWIKSKKKNKASQQLLEYVMTKFECGPKDAQEYVELYNRTPEGKTELFDICRGFGLTEKEVDKLMESKDE